jgi:hypothetical protein
LKLCSDIFLPPCFWFVATTWNAVYRHDDAACYVASGAIGKTVSGAVLDAFWMRAIVDFALDDIDASLALIAPFRNQLA